MEQPAPHPAATQRQPEPPLIERARRIGWALLALALAAMLFARFGPAEMRLLGQIAGGAAALFGLLAIVNVALVRGLYRQVAEMGEQTVEQTGEKTGRD